MGVSFKVSKTGSRFRPKPSLHSETFIEDVSETSKQSSQPRKQEAEEVSGVPSITEGNGIYKEHEVSFTLNLYPDGYSIGKPSEKDTVHQGILQDVPKSLHPYDRASETLFSAIESGRLPGDILENIPCKYVDGTLVCEVRDYRKCGSERGSTSPAIDGSPVITKVCLRMSLENVVKDIPLISDNSWSYGDLMEVESRILKALQPQLCLDPCPKLDRLSTNPVPTKLDLALSSLRRKRLRQMPEVTVTSNNKIYGKKVCIDRVPESSHGRLEESGIVTGNLMPQHGNENLTAQSIVQNSMLALRPKSFVPDASVPSVPLVSQQSRYQMGVGMPRSMQDHGPGSVVNPSGSSPGGPELVSYAENLNSTASFHPKRENQDGPLSPLSSFNKRSRLTPMGSDGFQPQQMGPSMDSLQGGDMSWKNTFLQQQALARGVQYQNTGIQKYPQQAFDGILKQEPGTVPFAAGQPALRFVPKEEPVDMDRVDGPEFNRGRSDMQMVGTDASHLDVQQQRIQQRLPQHSFMRSAFPQTWNNIGQHIEKDSRKEEQFQKRKSAQSPRLSAGALPQSPLSSKSGEFSSGSVGPHFGAVATSAALASAQKEKSAVTSVPAIGGTQSLTSSANDSMQRHHQAQVAAKRRSNSLPKTPAMSGVGSPASVTNMSVPLNANSPSVGTPPLADQTMLERFSKIDMVATRYHLNSRKNKVDNYPGRKRNVYSPHDLSVCLANVSNNEDFKDDAKPLSKSLIGGSMNTCKIRLLNFAHQERIVQGNVVSIVHHLRRMVMLQKSSDGTVAFYFGDAEDFDILAAEENLPTLPNSHSADLLAAQFCKLMIREGYPPLEENLQLKPTCTNIASSSAANTAGIAPNNPGAEMQQYADAVSGQATSIDVKPNVGSASLNSSQNLLANARMLPPGNPQAVQMSQGLLSGVSMPARPQQLDPQPSLQSQQQLQQSQQQQQQQNQHSLIQQQQQQQQQFQRSPMMLGPNSLSHLSAMGQNSNMHLGNHMVNKASSLQLQMLQPQQQQQQQQQQQTQMQRKMMMGLGTGMGNMGNNMVGLGGLGNPMGMGGARGIGGTGMSTPMAPISSMGMGNVGQNPISISNVISQQLRSGKLTPTQAQLMAAKLKRPMMGASQSGLAGISGGRQMMPGAAGLSSMLGQNLNRPNMSPMQRTAMASMGPPKLMNIYMNQQQQHMQLQQQQQQQLQQQLQQQQIQHQQQQLQPPPQQPQQLQQQETTSPLQAVVSPSQVGSPSMGIAQLNQQPQQQLSPQQLSQRTPMSPQISSGAIHGLSAGNPETCPASPQLSSQTLGSVGSITNSPMELQGVNKSNSVGNN